MKNVILILILLLLSVSCMNYNSNRRINNRKTPVVIIAIDTETKSVIFRDGDNKIFTFTDNMTTQAISASLNIGDTIRFVEHQKFIIKDGKLEYNFLYDSLGSN